MKVSAVKRKELTQTIVSLMGTIRVEKGCSRCDLFSGLDDENTLCLFEEWDTRKSFETHRQSECFKVLLGGMNLLAELCEILFYMNTFQEERKEGRKEGRKEVCHLLDDKKTLILKGG
jgi:quinol monooxygenase YgiN